MVGVLDVGAVIDKTGNVNSGFSSCLGARMSPSPSCGTFVTFERRVGDESLINVDVSSSLRTLVMLDLGVPNRNGESVLGRVSS